MRLNNRVALVTGASRGIGKAIALALAREGADIALNCSSSVQAAEEVASEIKRFGRRAIVIQADVADKVVVDRMVKEVVSDFGKIDILINNAGMSVVGASAGRRVRFFDSTHLNRLVERPFVTRQEQLLTDFVLGAATQRKCPPGSEAGSLRAP